MIAYEQAERLRADGPSAVLWPLRGADHTQGVRLSPIANGRRRRAAISCEGQLASLGVGAWRVALPFKHNATRRHRIPRAQYRVRNWPQYDAGLCCRGDRTLWLDQAAIAGWQAARRTTPGGQGRYSDLAISWC